MSSFNECHTASTVFPSKKIDFWQKPFSLSLLFLLKPQMMLPAACHREGRSGCG